MGWFGKWFTRKPRQAARAPLALTPRRAEIRFGDEGRVQFQVQDLKAGGHPDLIWTVYPLDEDGGARMAGKFIDPTGEHGVFLAFPVEKPTNLRVRATLAGTGRFGEAILVVNPPTHSGGHHVAGYTGGLVPLGSFT
jgi:hypothetical protein